MPSFPFRSFAPLAAALALTGCGATYQPGRAAAFQLDASASIDDEDIRKAFEARPQLPGQIHLAYYTFDPAVAKDLDAALAAIPGVVSVYRIPALMVSGQRRIDEQSPWGGWGGGAGRDVTVKKLRLFAARAHADALVVVDHGYRTGGVNGLAVLDILLLPILFMPFVDTTVEGYAEGFLIDVRNGYLYGQVSEDDKRGQAFAQIYARSAESLAAEQWVTLRGALTSDLAKLVAGERARGAALPAVTAVPAPGSPGGAAGKP